jgi:hypothetical protein
VSLDYVDLMNSAANSDSETVYLSEYFCELALLQSDLGDFPMGEVAASCVLLSRLVQNAGRYFIYFQKNNSSLSLCKNNLQWYLHIFHEEYAHIKPSYTFYFIEVL